MSNDVCLTVALDVLLMCCDLLLMCTSYTHMHGDYWRKAERLAHSCECIAGAVLFLYCFILSICDYWAERVVPFVKDNSPLTLRAYDRTHHSQIDAHAHIRTEIPSMVAMVVEKECCCCIVEGSRKGVQKLGYWCCWAAG